MLNPVLNTLAFAILVVTMLQSNQVSAQIPPTNAQITKFEPLQIAAHRGDLSGVMSLIRSKTSLDQRDSYGRTALMIATFANHTSIVEALLKSGANTALLENDRYDAVTIAAVANNIEILNVLIKSGASTTLTTSRYDGTALIAAAHLGHVAVVKSLIAGGAPLDHVNNLEWTALIEAIVLGDGGSNHVEIVRALAKAGANVAIVEGTRSSPLQLAREKGFQDIVNVLLEFGAK